MHDRLNPASMQATARAEVPRIDQDFPFAAEQGERGSLMGGGGGLSLIWLRCAVATTSDRLMA